MYVCMYVYTNAKIINIYINLLLIRCSLIYKFANVYDLTKELIIYCINSQWERFSCMGLSDLVPCWLMLQTHLKVHHPKYLGKL